MSNNSLLEKMAVGEIKTQSDYLAQKIKDMIISNEVEEGYLFPNENEFCKILNVGRGTLREAYKILDTEGFIRRTKQGTFVKGRDDIARQGDFYASLQLSDVDEMNEFVCGLEPYAVELAAERITDEQLAKLRELLEECEAVKDKIPQMNRVNAEFHSYLRGICGNHLIISVLSAYYDFFDKRVIRSIYSSGRYKKEFLENSLAQHRQLLEALEQRDGEKAKKISYEHLMYDIEYLHSLKI